jgi:hypothetical protein
MANVGFMAVQMLDIAQVAARLEAIIKHAKDVAANMA